MIGDAGNYYLHYRGLSEDDENRLHEIGRDHLSTAPPRGIIHNSGEWEPSEGVLIRWPLGIPVSLVAEMSEDVMVTTASCGLSLVWALVWTESGKAARSATRTRRQVSVFMRNL